MKFNLWPFGRAQRKDSVTTSEQLLEAFKQVFGTNATAAGETVTLERALQVAAVLACARVIANGISQVPLKLFQESADGRARNPARTHRLYRVLHRKPNGWQTSFAFRQTMGFHLVLAGNFYAFKNAPLGDMPGAPIELLPFEPQTVTPRRNGNETEYVVRLNGKEQTLPASMVWHVVGPSWNGWYGMEAVRNAREAIGLAIATERSQTKLHANGVSPSGVYTVEGKLSPQQHKDLTQWIKENYSGPNAGLPLILDRSAKWVSQAMSGVDAQHLETRRHQIEEICRALGVFPQMIGFTDKTATFASAEAFFIAHVVHTLAPWYECIEQSIDVNLLSERDDRAGIYAKFVTEGLLRGSMEATGNYLDKLVNGGLMTPNEARAKLDLNADEDPASDKLRVPANIVGKQPQQPDAARPTGQQDEPQSAAA